MYNVRIFVVVTVIFPIHFVVRLAVALRIRNTVRTLCLKNVPPLTYYNLYIHVSIATIFGKNDAEKVGNQNILYFFTSSNVSTLPGETENPEIASFHLNAACFFTKKHKTVKNIT